MVLTATRPGEARKPEWKEVDFEKRIWHIPGSRMKTGRDHRVPLSHQAVKVFEQAKALGGDVLVFPGNKHGRPSRRPGSASCLKKPESSAIPYPTIRPRRASCTPRLAQHLRGLRHLKGVDFVEMESP